MNHIFPNWRQKRVTRVFAAVLVLTMFLTLMPAAAFTAEYTDGVYEGVGQGINGEILVEITISGGAITIIDILSHAEPFGIWELAANEIPDRIIEAQSTEVDAVPGAVESSDGIKEAVADALQKAAGTGGEPDETLAPGRYSVPINFHDANYFPTINPLNSAISGSGIYPNINSRALLEVSGDSYTITLQYNSAQLYDYMQIVDPAQFDDVKALNIFFVDMKAGDFNVPSDIKDDPKEYERRNNANIVEAELYSGEMNPYYLGGLPTNRGDFKIATPTELSTEDQSLDIGYITFKVPKNTDFNNPILLKNYSRATNAYLPSSSNNKTRLPQELALAFQIESAVKLPNTVDELQTAGWAWVNSIIAASTANQNTFPNNGAAQLPPIFEPTAVIHTSDSDAIDATFTLVTPTGDADTVVSVERIASRTMPDPSSADILNYWIDRKNITFYDTCDIADGTFTLSYRDMAFGVPLRVLTKTMAAGTYFYGWLYLTPSVPTPGEQTDNGVTLSYPSDAIPAGSVFTAPDYTDYESAVQFVTERYFNTEASYAVNGDRYKVYSVSLLTSNGNMVKPTKPVTLQFPIPEEWDMSKLRIIQAYEEERVSNLSSLQGSSAPIIDAEHHTVSVVSRAGAAVNSTYFFIEEAPILDNIQSLLQSDGLYRATVRVMHADADIPSMSNAVVKNRNIGYIEVAEGRKTLYLELQPIAALGTMGYLSEMFYFDGGSGGVKTLVEVLSYFTQAEIDAAGGDLDFAKDLGLTYPKRIAVPLNNIEADGGYLINVIVPIMDALGGGEPGGGSGAQNARIFFTSVAGAGSNPLTGYDKTILDVALKAARAALEALSGEEAEALQTAIGTAEAQYNNTGLDSDGIKAAETALRNAIAGNAAPTPTPTPVPTQDPSQPIDLDNLADGEYSVDTELWQYSTNEYSMGNGAIDHSQSRVVVKDGQAEVRLMFQPLQRQFANVNFVGYLLDLWRIDDIQTNGSVVTDYTRTPAVVYSYYTGITDDYGPPEGRSYPRELGIDVEIGEEYTPVRVAVPVMEAISPGSGEQFARLRLDWDSLRYPDGSTPGAANKAALNNKIDEAKAIIKGSYTDASWDALQRAIDAAETVAKDAAAIQAQVDAHVTALDNAIGNLTTVTTPTPTPTPVPTAAPTAAPSPTQAPSQPDDGLADGVYSVATELRQYASSSLSMGHGAIDHSRSRLVVSNGQAEVRLVFQPLQQQLNSQNFVGYLLDLWRVDNIQTSGSVVTDYTRTPATVYSYYTGVTDDYGPPVGRSYPMELGIRVEIGEQYTTVRVAVPVMEAIQTGSGEQFARLGLDWNSLSRIGSSVPVDPTPTAEPIRPTDPAVPTAEPEEPTSDPEEPTTEPEEPTTDPEEPGEPTEPGEPGEPTGPDPSDPTEPEPGEPTDPDPVDPTEPEPGEPTEPVTEPEEPTTEPDEPDPVETAPVGDGQVSVEYTQSEDTVTLVLTEDKVNDIIDNSAGLVSIDMSKASNATAAVLPKEAVTRLADADLAVEIKLPQGSVTLSPEAAKSAAVQAISGNVALEVKPVAVSSLNARQQAAVGSAPVYDISLTSNNQYITSFDGGQITIALPYTLKAGERASGVIVWYLDDEGNIQRMNTMYDVRTQTVIFTTDHLSMYFVTYEAAAASGGSGDSGSVSNAGGGNNAGGAAQPASPSLTAPAAPIAPVAPAAAALPFTDVRPSNWYYGDVAYVYSRNIMGGTSASAFGPNVPMDRAMLVTVIGRLSGANVGGYANANSFTDVIAGQYYAPYVAWAQASAIIGGVGNNAFAPNAPISRQDLAVVLMNYVRYTGKPLPVKQAYNGFADEAAVAGYARASVEAIYRAGIIGGKPGNLFDPRGSATRAEVAAILHRFVEATK